MYGAKGKTAQVPVIKNQPPIKKGVEAKPVKKEWSAQDYVSEKVSLEEVK